MLYYIEDRGPNLENYPNTPAECSGIGVRGLGFRASGLGLGQGIRDEGVFGLGFRVFKQQTYQITLGLLTRI